MGIKDRVKISFVTVIFMVFLICVVSISVAFLIKKNSFLNNQISQIILFQERMNQVIQDTDRSNTLKKIDKLKDSFNQYEKTFEKIKNTIPLKEDAGFASILLEVKADKEKISKKLKKIFIDEQEIEEAFSKMYKMQEKNLDLKKRFDDIYPKEKIKRSTLYKKILSKENFQAIHYFGMAQYYSKETLYQHKTEESLKRWIDSISDTMGEFIDKALIKDLENYKGLAKKIGHISIEMQKLKNNKAVLQKRINSILQKNKKLATNISQIIEDMSMKIRNKLFFILIFITAFVIIFVVFFGLKVLKNVGLSVNEIEQKVEDGLRQIKELNTEIELTQKEVIFTMGTIAEYRSKETGNHVKRVAEYSKILALHYGLSEEESQMLKQASPMHDIGKVAIPDAVLNKPGRFNDEERKIMDTHAFLGYEMLNKSQRPLLKTASIIAYEHHEKWNGSGYPRGLSGEEIHIYGRITALADVFDALGSDRVYKKAWDNDRIFKLFKQERGEHFDPRLIDIFFDNLDEFLKIQRTFKDI